MDKNCDLELLENVKKIVSEIGSDLTLRREHQNQKSSFHAELERELKSSLDTLFEERILKQLLPFGFPVLSEETGYVQNKDSTGKYFIVDPLDGTFNFIRGLGPATVSVGFWKHDQPIFGVIYNLIDRKLYWGGKDFGAYCEGKAIHVSSNNNKMESSLCTGIPSRFDFNDPVNQAIFWEKIKSFAKIRMFGCASVSILRVAEGAAECYWENSIMLWDVAAALAILEGAKGQFKIMKKSKEYELNVSADNGFLVI